jgi:hypothetical protein
MKEQAEMTGSVTGDVDTHADVHVCVVVCSTRIGGCVIPIEQERIPGVAGMAQRLGVIDKTGIEGTGTYGAGLTQFLAGSGVEVNRPDRSERFRHDQQPFKLGPQTRFQPQLGQTQPHLASRRTTTRQDMGA